jgi:hypothetical protein
MLMEQLTVKFDDDTGKDFDTLLHGLDGVRTFPEGGDLVICTKHGALESGRAGAIITFTVEVDGKFCRAQSVTPVRQLILALKLLQSKYTDDGMPR